MRQVREVRQVRQGRQVRKVRQVREGRQVREARQARRPTRSQVNSLCNGKMIQLNRSNTKTIHPDAPQDLDEAPP